jgi:hypothetical protein
MRLWSIHPKYLDAKGLAALWREGLLAQKVLHGETKGYRNHPQLTRFLESSNPLGAIASYLRGVAAEAEERGYRFDRSRIVHKRYRGSIPVTTGQLRYELDHLLNKLENRDRPRREMLRDIKRIETHSLFDQAEGDVAEWEVIKKRPA